MKERITITLDDDILKLITTLAEQEGRSVSNQINKIIKDFFTAKE